MSDTLNLCRQCGHPQDSFTEGVCDDCWNENQIRLDRHNAEIDRWKALTDAERDALIRRAYT